jgi:hypothetical protein
MARAPPGAGRFLPGAAFQDLHRVVGPDLPVEAGVGQLELVGVAVDQLAVHEVDPPRRLVQSFRARWSEDVKREGPSRVTWEIEPVGDSCCLTVTHDELRGDANQELYGGWPMILSGLKTLLETGERLTTPGSLRYGG